MDMDFLTIDFNWEPELNDFEVYRGDELFSSES